MNAMLRILLVLFTFCVSTRAGSFAVTSVTRVGTIDNLDWPESVLVDCERDTIYISNIETDDFGAWEDDGKGFITAIVDRGKHIKKYWVNSRSYNILNAPKGMCLKGNILYVADNRRLLAISIKTPNSVNVLKIPKARKLNDITTDGKFLYISDTGRGVIYKFKNGKVLLVIKAIKGVNGLACFKGKLFAVSTSEGEIYQIDKKGVLPPHPMGLKKYFKGLDGIVFFKDGSSLVTDLRGQKLFSVNSEMDDVIKLANVKSPADLGVDMKRRIIYIPQLKSGQVTKFKY